MRWRVVWWWGLMGGNRSFGGRWGSMFEDLAQNIAVAPPRHPKPLTNDGLLGLFKSEQVGRNVKLDPASFADMCGREMVIKPSLEVVYDAV